MADAALVGQAQGVNKNLGSIAEILRTAFPLHSNTGSFTLAVAASKTVTDTTIKTGSIVLLMPVNAAAATLMSGANALYTSARTAGSSFTVSTAGGGNAAGTEQFEYIAISTG
jgi:hypothetical protein